MKEPTATKPHRGPEDENTDTFITIHRHACLVFHATCMASWGISAAVTFYAMLQHRCIAVPFCSVIECFTNFVSYLIIY